MQKRPHQPMGARRPLQMRRTHHPIPRRRLRPHPLPTRLHPVIRYQKPRTLPTDTYERCHSHNNSTTLSVMPLFTPIAQPKGATPPDEPSPGWGRTGGPGGGGFERCQGCITGVGHCIPAYWASHQLEPSQSQGLAEHRVSPVSPGSTAQSMSYVQSHYRPQSPQARARTSPGEALPSPEPGREADSPGLARAGAGEAP